MSERFVLHGYFLSGPTYKVGLMLKLTGTAYTYRHVDLPAGAHKTPDYLTINRFGQVPALVDSSNGRSLVQSAAILEWLADFTGKFGGESRDERLAIREWLYWSFDKLAPPIYKLRSAKMGRRPVSQSTAELFYADGVSALDLINKHLADRGWLVGNGFTIADIDAYGVIAYAAQAGHKLADYPHIAGWAKRFEALPGFGMPDDILP